MTSPSTKPRIHTPFPVLVKDWAAIYESGKFTEGQFTLGLENVVSDWCGKPAVACNSAGTGLFMLGALHKGITCIVPNNTFPATATMMMEAGWSIRLADCSREDFSLTPETILAAAEGCNPQAVVLTHVGGGLALRYREIAALCKEKGWLLFEDAAHALGTVSRDGLRAGDLGDAAVFSLYPTKALPTGEGGIVVTRNTALALELRDFRNYGKRVEAGVIKYGRGFNFRMSEWDAAIAYRQMLRHREIMEMRAESAYQLSKIVTPLVDWDGKTNWYKFIAPASFPSQKRAGKVYQSSDQVSQALGIPGDFPVSRWLDKNHICLPIGEQIYRGMTTGEIEKWLLS